MRVILAIGITALVVLSGTFALAQDDGALSEDAARPTSFDEAEAQLDPDADPLLVIDETKDGEFQSIYVNPVIPPDRIPDSVRSLDDLHQFYEEYDSRLAERGIDTHEERLDHNLRHVPAEALENPPETKDSD